MTITLKKPESAEYYNFSKEVKQLAKKDFGDFHYGEVSCVPVSRVRTKRMAARNISWVLQRKDEQQILLT